MKTKKAENFHAAKARKRMAGPRPVYPAERPTGTFRHILVHDPMTGKVSHLRLDFEKGARIDQYRLYRNGVPDPDLTNLTKLVREVLPEYLITVRMDWH